MEPHRSSPARVRMFVSVSACAVPKDTYEEELAQQPNMYWCWNWCVLSRFQCMRRCTRYNQNQFQTVRSKSSCEATRYAWYCS